jgi:flagellar basal-body rod protein FlgB
MSIIDMPIFAMLRTRMQWHQQRQQILAQNVANADTPNYRPLELAPPTFDGNLTRSGVALARTEPNHIASDASGEDSRFGQAGNLRYEVRPGGNAVTHEDEMMKVASNQMDFEAVAQLYTRSLALIKVAIDRS